MDPVVRVATADDIDDLDRLQALAREGLVDARGGALLLAENLPIVNWRALLDSDDVVVYVGTLLDVVLSFMVMELRSAINRGCITNAFVEEGARELGLGDTMVEQAKIATRAAGLTGIEAVALPGDRSTKNLYERAGMTARKITVYKALPPLDG